MVESYIDKKRKEEANFKDCENSKTDIILSQISLYQIFPSIMNLHIDLNGYIIKLFPSDVQVYVRNHQMKRCHV